MLLLYEPIVILFTVNGEKLSMLCFEVRSPTRLIISQCVIRCEGRRDSYRVNYSETEAPERKSDGYSGRQRVKVRSREKECEREEYEID